MSDLWQKPKTAPDWHSRGDIISQIHAIGGDSNNRTARYKALFFIHTRIVEGYTEKQITQMLLLMGYIEDERKKTISGLFRDYKSIYKDTAPEQTAV